MLQTDRRAACAPVADLAALLIDQFPHLFPRPPVNVFHKDMREFAVSSNAEEIFDIRRPLELPALRFIFVEKNRIGDRRPQNVAADKLFPDAGNDRLEIFQTEFGKES